MEVPKLNIDPRMPQYYGAPAADTYASALYAGRSYVNMPDRAAFLCDWPYAVRRYNGSGPASYNYQAIVLTNVLTG